MQTCRKQKCNTYVHKYRKYIQHTYIHMYIPLHRRRARSRNPGCDIRCKKCRKYLNPTTFSPPTKVSNVIEPEAVGLFAVPHFSCESPTRDLSQSQRNPCFRFLLFFLSCFSIKRKTSPPVREEKLRRFPAEACATYPVTPCGSNHWSISQ